MTPEVLKKATDIAENIQVKGRELDDVEDSKEHVLDSDQESFNVIVQRNGNLTFMMPLTTLTAVLTDKADVLKYEIAQLKAELEAL